jgi:hypothetical protein
MQPCTFYHRRTEELLGRALEPKVDDIFLQVTEHRLGTRLHGSVREWFKLANAVDILQQHSNQDHPLNLKDLELCAGAELRPFLIFMHENQGVCRWAVDAQEGSDPTVWVDSSSYDALPEWVSTGLTFSVFVYCRVWDFTTAPFSVSLQSRTMSDDDIEKLATKLEAGPVTSGGFMFVNCKVHRFGVPWPRIIVTRGLGTSHWWLRADEEAKFRELCAFVARTFDVALAFPRRERGVGERLFIEATSESS